MRDETKGKKDKDDVNADNLHLHRYRSINMSAPTQIQNNTTLHLHQYR